MPEEIYENAEFEAAEPDAMEPISGPQKEAPDEADSGEWEADDLPPGMSPEGLRRFLSARHAREICADRRMQAHYAALAARGEALKAEYPDFDLAREMEDPTFARLTAPGVDIDPGTAYEIVHRHALQKARRSADLLRAAQAVSAGSLRPDESALTGTRAAAAVRTDPRNLSSQDRKDIRRRVERGERVTF